jgi:hypothetical protein
MTDVKKFICVSTAKKRLMFFLQQAVEAHNVVRRQGSHVSLYNLLTNGGEVVKIKR